MHVRTDLYLTLHVLGTMETTGVLEIHLNSLPCGINKVLSNVPSLPGSRRLPQELHSGNWPELMDSTQCWVTGGWVVSLHVQRVFSPFAEAILVCLAAEA